LTQRQASSRCTSRFTAHPVPGRCLSHRTHGTTPPQGRLLVTLERTTETFGERPMLWSYCKVRPLPCHPPSGVSLALPNGPQALASLPRVFFALPNGSQAPAGSRSMSLRNPWRRVLPPYAGGPIDPRWPMRRLGWRAAPRLPALGRWLTAPGAPVRFMRGLRCTGYIPQPKWVYCSCVL